MPHRLPHFAILLRLVCLLAMLAATTGQACHAQYAIASQAALASSISPGTIQTLGTSSFKQRPAVARLAVQLSGKGKTIKEALTKLADRREAAKLQLQALGAQQDTVRLSAPRITSGKSPEQQQMEQMLQQQLRNQGREIPEGLKVPQYVMVMSVVTADWDLSESSEEEVLTFVTDLERKVEQADLAGLKEAEQLSPAEQELKEELEAMRSQFGGMSDDESKPGEPHMFYLAVSPDQQRTEATRRAFQQAKTEAAQLAQAADAELGKLSALSGAMTSTGTEALSNPYGYGGGEATMLQEIALAADDHPVNQIGVSTQFGPITFEVTVKAAFELKQPASP